MPANLGYQFAPGADARGTQNQGQPQRRGLSPQSAVRLLQLRVPERPAASAIAPQALLQSPGAGGLGGDGLAGIIKALAGRAAPPPMAPPPMVPPQMGAAAAPSQQLPIPPQATAASAPPPPRITPGVDEAVGDRRIEPIPEQPMPTQEEIDRLLNTPVGNGQTLGNGGGFAGRWRDWITGPPIESLF